MLLLLWFTTVACYESKQTSSLLQATITVFLASLWSEKRFYHSFKNSARYFTCVPPSVRQGYSRELFQFEEDRFDNVPALIRFYVGGRRPISQASGAVIFNPITRSVPLRVIIERQTDSSSSISSIKGADRDKYNQASKRRSFSSAHNDTLQIINPLLRWEKSAEMYSSPRAILKC